MWFRLSRMDGIHEPIRPRQYQTKGLDDLRAQIGNGVKRAILVAPTGAGKTTVAWMLIHGALQKGSVCWFVAHRRELIKQAHARMLRGGIPLSDVGVVMGDLPLASGEVHENVDGLSDHELWTKHGRRRPRARVQVASIDTLRNRIAQDLPASSPEEARRMGHPDVIVIDECHRSLAPSYTRLFALYPFAVVVGLTATPYRADGRGLGGLYEAIVPVSTPRELIHNGYLVEPRVWTVPRSELPDMSSVKIATSGINKGDYAPGELAAAVDSAKLVGDIVDHWQRRADGRRTIGFAASVAHSKHIIERFVAAGVKAEHLDGETPTEERDGILARLASGETTVVFNVGVCTEGWDCPSVKCCILARPTKSTGLFLQMAGRILRPWQDVPALILDHAGCVVEHGFPQDDREFSLEDEPKKQKRKASVRVVVCEGCSAVLPGGSRSCPYCGWVAPAPEVSLEEAEAELVEVRPVSVEEMGVRYKALLAEASRTGRKPGWAYYKFKDEFGREPPKGLKPKEAPVQATDEEKKAEWEKLKQIQAEKSYRYEWIRFRFLAKYGHEIPPAWHVEEMKRVQWAV